MDITLKPYLRTFLKSVKLGEIMIREVISVRLGALFSEVESLMRMNHIRHIPVVMPDNQLIGLMTQRDLYRIASPHISEDGGRFYLKEYLDRFILEHVMIKNPFAMKEDDSLADALIAMGQHRYGCVLVTSDCGKLTGIITLADIVNLAANIVTPD